MRPKVTIVTPTYNRANLICETIESILAQTWKDFELLIIDDGSTDETEQTVRPYLSDPRVRYFYKPNGGEPSAVNEGWRRASGEYFTQINSDDPALPNLLKEMCAAMDAHPKAVVGYCDFRFIDEHGDVLGVTKSPDWDFVKQLSEFSCVAAAPGTFFRRSAFSHWETLRRGGYRHINDIEMFWDMALEGDFLHVPKVLANWRQHPGQISFTRYRAIPEIEQWFQYYFSREDLPPEIVACKDNCWGSILTFFQALIWESNLPDNEKKRELARIDKMRFRNGMEYVNLQVGDTDLIGNKFNGHDLHLLLNQHGVRSVHCVCRKLSDDEDTILAERAPNENYAQWLLNSKQFAFSDIVHLHLIHNTDFDIQLLPLLSRLKPLVITLHDAFFLGGHCIHHGDCGKWRTGCFDCQYPDIPFAVRNDASAIRYLEKETAFQNSDISLIVASRWMEDQVRLSPVFRGKRVYRIPFGVNQELFHQKDAAEAKAELGIPSDNLTIMFRADKSPFKGLDVIVEALRQTKFSKPVTLLLVGQTGLMNEFRGRFSIKDYGWLTDDAKLAKLYQACDLFLMPSRQEAFGMMAIEAMSCGKTVLALNGTSLPDVIHSPECGIAVEETEFTATFQMLIDHPEEREKHGAASLRYAKEYYTLERYLDAMMSAYREIITSHQQTQSALRAAEQLQINCNLEKEVTKRYELKYSKSWRITKPLRALSYASKSMVKGFTGKYHAYRDYMQDEISDALDDAAIRNSRCWRITAPLRWPKWVITKRKT